MHTHTILTSHTDLLDITAGNWLTLHCDNSRPGIDIESLCPFQRPQNQLGLKIMLLLEKMMGGLLEEELTLFLVCMGNCSKKMSSLAAGGRATLSTNPFSVLIRIGVPLLQEVDSVVG